MSALQRWRDALHGWAVPEEILAAAPESPWTLPVECLQERAAVTQLRTSPALARALEALPRDGTVLDVGVGPGAASLPLASYASQLIGVDRNEELLARFRTAATATPARVETVLGDWPAVAHRVPVADVVVCFHVLYNVADLAPFVAALSAHARQRVVVELPQCYPFAWMNDLWWHFHQLERPHGPSADDAAAALVELGVAYEREDWQQPRWGGFRDREDAIAMVRRRLCLSPERDGEVAEALGDRLTYRDGGWSAMPDTTSSVALWWAPEPPVGCDPASTRHR